MLEATAQTTVKTIADLPGPKSLPVVGNLLQIDLDKFHIQLEQWCEEFGPIFKVHMGKKEIVCLADSATFNEMLRLRPSVYRRIRSVESVTTELELKGVFAAEGDEWKMQRKVVAQALNSAHIHRFFPNMRTTTDRLLHRWLRAADANTNVDLCRDVMRYTVDVTTQLAFGIDMNTIESDGQVVQHNLDKVFPMLHKRTNAPFPYWRYFRLPRDRELDRALASVKETVNGFIEDCRKRMAADPSLYESPTNFLEAIIAAQATETGADFTDAQIYANVMTLLLAGEDTTANTIAWTCKYFIDFPQYFARARSEADAVLGDDAVIQDHLKLRELPFIDACVNEAMRLKPVAPIFPIEAVEDIELMGYHFPAGTPVFGLNRFVAVDDENFTDPKTFNPDRWLETAEQEKHNEAVVIPFGTGPRFCPGRNLALAEIKMVLAMLCRSFDLSFANPTIPVEEKLAFAMMPKNLTVNFSRRTGSQISTTSESE